MKLVDPQSPTQTNLGDDIEDATQIAHVEATPEQRKSPASKRLANARREVLGEVLNGKTPAGAERSDTGATAAPREAVSKPTRSSAVSIDAAPPKPDAAPATATGTARPTVWSFSALMAPKLSAALAPPLAPLPPVAELGAAVDPGCPLPSPPVDDVAARISSEDCEEAGGNDAEPG